MITAGRLATMVGTRLAEKAVYINEQLVYIIDIGAFNSLLTAASMTKKELREAVTKMDDLTAAVNLLIVLQYNTDSFVKWKKFQPHNFEKFYKLTEAERAELLQLKLQNATEIIELLDKRLGLDLNMHFR
jgi:hypothetical protein